MHKYPELELLYHIPNEGKRSKSNGAALRRQGLKKGVPDLCLPVARGGFHGLYIEMKRVGEKPTDNQKRWLQLLKQQGYCTTVCDEGWEQAVKVIEDYMKLRQKPCHYCETTFFIKIIQCAKPLLAPLTPEQALRDKLQDLTGEDYRPIQNNFCPFCGRDLRRN